MIDQLIEDYERRLEMVRSLIVYPKDQDIEERRRFKIKEGCYREFIVELKQLADKE